MPYHPIKLRDMSLEAQIKVFISFRLAEGKITGMYVHVCVCVCLIFYHHKD